MYYQEKCHFHIISKEALLRIIYISCNVFVFVSRDNIAAAATIIALSLHAEYISVLTSY